MLQVQNAEIHTFFLSDSARTYPVQSLWIFVKVTGRVLVHTYARMRVRTLPFFGYYPRTHLSAYIYTRLLPRTNIYKSLETLDCLFQR